jgi:hypothetical protein
MWLVKTDKIHIFAPEMQANSGEYGLQTKLAPSPESRVLAHDIQPIYDE